MALRSLDEFVASLNARKFDFTLIWRRNCLVRMSKAGAGEGAGAGGYLEERLLGEDVHGPLQGHHVLEALAVHV